MHTDDISIQEISMPITVVGLGGAGTNVVTILSQHQIKGVECVAIASKLPYELQKIPVVRKTSLYQALAPRKGFDGYPWEGLTVPRIKDMCAENHMWLSASRGVSGTHSWRSFLKAC